jgi:hypothetical protein
VERGDEVAIKIVCAYVRVADSLDEAATLLDVGRGRLSYWTVHIPAIIGAFAAGYKVRERAIRSKRATKLRLMAAEWEERHKGLLQGEAQERDTLAAEAHRLERSLLVEKLNKLDEDKKKLRQARSNARRAKRALEEVNSGQVEGEVG